MSKLNAAQKRAREEFQKLRKKTQRNVNKLSPDVKQTLFGNEPLIGTREFYNLDQNTRDRIRRQWRNFNKKPEVYAKRLVNQFTPKAPKELTSSQIRKLVNAKLSKAFQIVNKEFESLNEIKTSRGKVQIDFNEILKKLQPIGKLTDFKKGPERDAERERMMDLYKTIKKDPYFESNYIKHGFNDLKIQMMHVVTQLLPSGKERDQLLSKIGGLSISQLEKFARNKNNITALKNAIHAYNDEEFDDLLENMAKDLEERIDGFIEGRNSYL